MVVSVKVENKAKRVPYQFRRSIVVMVDADGKEHLFSRTGQAVLNRKRNAADPLAAPLPAGAEGVTELAFELPAKRSRPRYRFKISHGGPVLDLVDDLLGGKTRLTL